MKKKWKVTFSRLLKKHQKFCNLVSSWIFLHWWWLWEFRSLSPFDFRCIKAVETGPAKGLTTKTLFKSGLGLQILGPPVWSTWLNIHGLVESYWVSWQKTSEHQFDAPNLMGTFLLVGVRLRSDKWLSHLNAVQFRHFVAGMSKAGFVSSFVMSPHLRWFSRGISPIWL